MTDEGSIPARSWDMPGRRRVDKTEIVARRRWSLPLDGEELALVWPDVERFPGQLAFEEVSA
jgi:hypothetical protein